VSGIIAANRENNIGINGIANDVKIMVVRTVPNGDERDKDVANSIIYAVKNGAKIINMSFGKTLSPQKELVEKAVAFAESKGVLLVHAAGNDGKNIDEGDNYPTAKRTNGKQPSNWIEVGAISDKDDETLVASFSNYGKNEVTLMAPGTQILSCTPDSKYLEEDGTSMAAPVVAGVAALLLSHFPNLTAVQLKEILVKSVTKPTVQKVIIPGTEDKGDFSELSQTGGIVNAYSAIKLAASLHPFLK
jgi:subtilisin family serine protease